MSDALLKINRTISNMSKETLEILTNEEVIAVNQDSLAVQGKKIVSNDEKQK